MSVLVSVCSLPLSLLPFLLGIVIGHHRGNGSGLISRLEVAIPHGHLNVLVTEVAGDSNQRVSRHHPTACSRVAHVVRLEVSKLILLIAVGSQYRTLDIGFPSILVHSGSPFFLSADSAL